MDLKNRRMVRIAKNKFQIFNKKIKKRLMINRH